MSRYPINIENELIELEKQSDPPMDGTVRKMLSLFLEGQNRAYDQGLKDGFAGPFENTKCLVSAPAECVEVQRASKEMDKLVGNIREIVLNEFEEHGFSDVMEGLGPVPEELCWGEKIYVTMQASYLQGFLLAFRMCDDEENAKESNSISPVRIA
jgi:hypothetical protein